jgi:hypothetical protein
VGPTKRAIMSRSFPIPYSPDLRRHIEKNTHRHDRGHPWPHAAELAPDHRTSSLRRTRTTCGSTTGRLAATGTAFISNTSMLMTPSVIRLSRSSSSLEEPEESARHALGLGQGQPTRWLRPADMESDEEDIARAADPPVLLPRRNKSSHPPGTR